MKYLFLGFLILILLVGCKNEDGTNDKDTSDDATTDIITDPIKDPTSDTDPGQIPDPTSDTDPGPVNYASSISFSDRNKNLDIVSGVVNIGKSTNESNITDYVLYWSIDNSKQSEIVTIPKTGNDLQYLLDSGIINSSTHLLVSTKNNIGEMTRGVKVLINDRIEIKLPDTGQTQSYTSTFGEDSDYSKNPQSYTDNSDGTITDNNTELMWIKATSPIHTYITANSYCSNNHYGYNGWRIPTAKELKTIMDHGSYNPVIDQTYFPSSQPASYWTSTQDGYLGIYGVIGVYFNNYGSISGIYKTGSAYTRCVRLPDRTALMDFEDNLNGTISHGRTGLMWQKEDDNNKRSFETSLTYCEGSSLGGHDDWRVPSVNELHSITDYDKYAPAIDTDFFTISFIHKYFVTSTTRAGNGDEWAYMISANSGSMTGFKKILSDPYVRCVRSEY